MFQLQIAQSNSRKECNFFKRKKANLKSHEIAYVKRTKLKNGIIFQYELEKYALT